MHLLSPCCPEAYKSTGMIGCNLHILCELTVSDSGNILERSVRLHDEPVLEIRGETARIPCAVSHNGLSVRKNLYIRSPVKGIDHKIRHFRLRISDTEHRRTLGRGHLSQGIMICEINAIIIRCSLLCLMREPAGSLMLIEDRLRDRHDGELAVIVDPWRRLMRLLEAADLVMCIHIRPSVTHRTCLRSPEVHTPRHGHSRISITCGKRMFRKGSHKRTDVIYRIF